VAEATMSEAFDEVAYIQDLLVKVIYRHRERYGEPPEKLAVTRSQMNALIENAERLGYPDEPRKQLLFMGIPLEACGIDYAKLEK
jgi:hypothetical protein